MLVNTWPTWCIYNQSHSSCNKTKIKKIGQCVEWRTRRARSQSYKDLTASLAARLPIQTNQRDHLTSPHPTSPQHTQQYTTIPWRLSSLFLMLKSFLPLSPTLYLAFWLLKEDLLEELNPGWKNTVRPPSVRHLPPSPLPSSRHLSWVSRLLNLIWEWWTRIFIWRELTDPQGVLVTALNTGVLFVVKRYCTKQRQPYNAAPKVVLTGVMKTFSTSRTNWYSTVKTQ